MTGVGGAGRSGRRVVVTCNGGTGTLKPPADTGERARAAEADLIGGCGVRAPNKALVRMPGAAAIGDIAGRNDAVGDRACGLNGKRIRGVDAVDAGRLGAPRGRLFGT